MKIKFFYLSLIAILLTAGSLYGQQDFIFYMNSFQIKIESITRTNLSPSDVSVLMNATSIQSAQINSLLSGKIISGNGTCSFFNRQIPMIFSDVELRFMSNEQIFSAISGRARSNANQTLFIQYEREGFPIKVRGASIDLLPDSATAHIEISIPPKIVADETVSNIIIKSTAANIAFDGSVKGIDFKSNSDISFIPKDSKYTFEMLSSNNWAVNIGIIDQTEKGIQFNGNASRGDINFSYNATLRADPQEAIYKISLKNPVTRYPECGYILTLKDGHLEYRYNMVSHSRHIEPGTSRIVVPQAAFPRGRNLIGPIAFIERVFEVSYCQGQFKADLELPVTAPDETGQRIKLNDIILTTDVSGNIYGKTKVPKFRIGQTYWVECESDNAWIFFDNWAEGEKHYSCEEKVNEPIKYYCDKYVFSILDRVDDLSRPGLTVFSGFFSFHARQASEIQKLHTKFFGTLTFTPSGISGDLTSGQYSLVPDEKPDEIFYYDGIQTTLQYIIDREDEIPDDPPVLFSLSNFSIQKMPIDNIRFCGNKIYSSIIRYTVHFSYPSFIDLEFLDKSLDDQGIFHSSKAPLRKSTVEVSEQEIEKTAYIDAEGKILWFWRLPLVIYVEGIELKHEIPGQQAPLAHINNADMIIPRLVSNNSLDAQSPHIREGVAFKGALLPNGEFSLSTHQRDNWFGIVKDSSFDCVLETISLASLENHPDSRENDLTWNGKIRFPFFTEATTDFVEVGFSVRNLSCSLINTISLSKTRNHVCDTAPPDSYKLSVSVEDLDYRFDNHRFHSKKTSYYTLDSQNERSDVKEDKTLIINSFISAYIVDTPTEYNHKISESSAGGECGRPQVLTSWIRGCQISPPDLVCYDPVANDRRTTIIGVENLCCQRFYFGTFQVTTRPEGSSEEFVLLEIPDIIYYFELTPNPLLDLNNSVTKFKTDDDFGNNGDPQVFSIPKGHLYFRNESGVFEGNLSLNTDMGINIPIEGSMEIMFMIDTRCGYFYIYGGAKFSFFMDFEGQIFICHAPWSTVSQHIKDNMMEIINWPGDSDEFFNNYFWKDTSPNRRTTTGIWIAGEVPVPIPIEILKINVGGSGWFWQIPASQPGKSGHILGACNTIEGELDLYIIVVDVTGTLCASYKTEDKEIILVGTATGCVCLDAWLAHTEGKASLVLSWSSKSGVKIDWDNTSVSAHIGAGGCSWCD